MDKAESEEEIEQIRDREAVLLRRALEAIHDEWKPQVQAIQEKVLQAEDKARRIKG